MQNIDNSNSRLTADASSVEVRYGDIILPAIEIPHNAELEQNS
jgi:hypothetical protein